MELSFPKVIQHQCQMNESGRSSDRMNTKEKAKHPRKNFPSAPLSTINPTWTSLGLNPDVQCE